MSQVEQVRTYFLERVFPFLVIGVAIAVSVGLFILLFYFLVWGLLIGTILWLVMLVKEKFFPSPIDHRIVNIIYWKKGRIIEHEEDKE